MRKVFTSIMLTAAAMGWAGDLTSVTPLSNQWEATDAIGRKLPGHDDTGDKKEACFVAMFYWTWHETRTSWDGSDDTGIEVKSIPEVLAEYPNAINDYWHPGWGTYGSTRPPEFYWGEPLFGYYHGTDPWVLRKHAEMLADAGVDCVVFDCTNGDILWEHVLWPLCETWTKAQEDGVNVPKIAFLLPFAANAYSYSSLHKLWDSMYSQQKYQNLWFYWKGKPLIMAYPDNLGTDGDDRLIRDFFQFRTAQPDYVSAGKDMNQWGWLQVSPIHSFGFDFNTMRPEECAVGVAQNASDTSNGHCCAFTLPGTYGRSYSKANGFDTREDAYLYGWNFQEQWEKARKYNPELVFVTGWNEWTSGMWNSSHGWSDPLSFVDEYDWDHSRDIEPTASWGDKGDVYYYQLIDNVRRYKGMDEPEPASEPKSIVLGAEGEWDGVTPEYKAYRGNTFHRDHYGRWNKYYTNFSGRNDITGARCTHDGGYVYFRVETDAALTDCTDPNWMMLFIDTDRDKATGWCGYDFIVNRQSPSADTGEVTIERCAGTEWEWAEAGKGLFAVNGNVLELALPKEVLGVGNELDIEFKWNDNMQQPGNPLDFYVSGDTAPGGRFNYRYTSTFSALGGVQAEGGEEGRIYNLLGVECRRPLKPGIYVQRGRKFIVK